MKEINDYNIRQLNLMLKKIDFFRKGEIDLGDLIDSLDGLLRVLEEFSEDWKSKFIEYWWDLEQIYADKLDSEFYYLSEKDRIEILNILFSLEKMVLEVI